MSEKYRVSIIGCANIGKSTLFNCIAGQKIAITHDTPGVTIDARKKSISIDNVALELIDTPGFDELRSPGADKTEQVHRIIKQCINTSTCIIHMIDANRGYNDHDRQWSRQYLKLGIPAVTLVNKIDTIDQLSLNHHHFQFCNNHLLFASAKNNHGVGQLREWILKYCCEETVFQSEIIDATGICFIGKPNAGKSTLSNLLIGDHVAVVSDQPGTTTDTIRHYFTYHDRDYFLYDTAGMRKKTKIRSDVERYSVNQSIETIRNKDVTTILVVDASQGVSDQDYRVIELLEKYRKRYMICINKWDKLNQDQKSLYRKYVDKIANNRDYVPIIMISSKDRRSKKTVMDSVSRISQSITLPPMSYLTKLMDVIIEKHRPALVNNKEVRIRVCYPTPGTTASVTIQGKRVSQLQSSYKRYLQNALQKHLKIRGIKLALVVKEDDNPYR
tara:strand:- start:1354 stop:2685 length:1332 start_codon:yes stop_codon:yes gene_type:complete